MNNQAQPKTHRSLAFWLGLTLHLALAAGIYVKATDRSPVVKVRQELERTPAPAPNVP